MLQKMQILNGVYGLAIGDALGVPVEFQSREERDKDPVTDMREYGTHNQPRGTWSDDTSMVLATLDALCRNSQSLGTVMDNFARWYQNGEYTAGGTVFDIGGTTHRAICDFIAGELPENCGGSAIYANGNGSLMRMLPVAYYVYCKYGVEINQQAIGCIYAFSGITHSHIFSKMCCVFYVYLAIYVMLEKDQKDLQTIIREAVSMVEEYYTEYEKSNLSLIRQSVKAKQSLLNCLEFDRDIIMSTGYVGDSLVASMWSLYNTNSYKDAVLKAVNLGKDTDTIGAITGSLAGLYYGLGTIPQKWVEDLKNKDLINSICNRFYGQYK